MKRLIWIVVLAAAMSGCTNLSDQQLGAYVGNSETKVYYKNLKNNRESIPADKRVYFRGVEQANDAGYHSNQEAGDATPQAGDESKS